MWPYRVRVRGNPIQFHDSSLPVRRPSTRKGAVDETGSVIRWTLDVCLCHVPHMQNCKGMVWAPLDAASGGQARLVGCPYNVCMVTAARLEFVSMDDQLIVPTQPHSIPLPPATVPQRWGVGSGLPLSVAHNHREIVTREDSGPSAGIACNESARTPPPIARDVPSLDRRRTW